MEILTVTLKTVTPLFMGGAYPKEKAELRASSIKGAMRFWYRAFDYTDANEENAIFGSADTGQGIFDIRIADVDPQRQQVGVSDGEFDQKKAYLGYGIIERQKNVRPYIDTGITYKVKITFKPVKNGKPENEKEKTIERRQKVKRSLWAMLMFGGLGARSRRGFGALSVIAIEGANLPEIWKFDDAGSYRKELEIFIRGLKCSLKHDLPEHTSWSKDKARCVVLGESKDRNGNITPFTDWDEAFKWIGAELQQFRSYHPARGNPNFPNDHDNIHNYLLRGSTPPLPQRAAFGLPHNYYFTNSFKGFVCKSEIDDDLLNILNGAIVDDKVTHVRFKLRNKLRTENNAEFISRFKIHLDTNGITDPDEITKITNIWKKSLIGVKGFVNYKDRKDRDKDGRRASPLIIHIQDIDNKACVAVTFMPAKFLPGVTPKVEIKGKWEDVLREYESCEVNVSDDFTAVDEFMTRLARAGVEIK